MRRILPQELLQGRDRFLVLSGPEEGQGQTVPRVHAVRVREQGLPELDGGQLEPALVEGAHRAQVVAPGADAGGIQLDLEGVGHGQGRLGQLLVGHAPQVLPRPLPVAEIAVGQAQGLMDRDRVRMPGQRPLQQVHGFGRPPPLEGQARQAHLRGRAVLIAGQRLAVQGLGLVSLARLRRQVGQPDPRGDVLGLEGQGPPEGVRGGRAVPLLLPGHPCRVGPAEASGRELGGPRVTGLGLGVIRVRVKGHPQLAEGVGQPLVRDAFVGEQPQDRRPPLVELRLDRRVEQLGLQRRRHVLGSKALGPRAPPGPHHEQQATTGRPRGPRRRSRASVWPG